MATVALALGDRLVGLPLLHELADVLVTAQTELPLRLLEHRRLIGAVPGMTVVTPALPHRRVGQGRDGIEIGERMTGLASLAHASGEKVLSLGGVRIVANGALAGGEGRVLHLVARIRR